MPMKPSRRGSEEGGYESEIEIAHDEALSRFLAAVRQSLRTRKRGFFAFHIKGQACQTRVDFSDNGWRES